MTFPVRAEWNCKLDLFNKIFWNYEFSAKNISTIHKNGVAGLWYSLVPPSLSIIYTKAIQESIPKLAKGANRWTHLLVNAHKCWSELDICTWVSWNQINDVAMRHMKNNLELSNF